MPVPTRFPKGYTPVSTFGKTKFPLTEYVSECLESIQKSERFEADFTLFSYGMLEFCGSFDESAPNGHAVLQDEEICEFMGHFIKRYCDADVFQCHQEKLFQFCDPSHPHWHLMTRPRILQLEIGQIGVRAMKYTNKLIFEVVAKNAGGTRIEIPVAWRKEEILAEMYLVYTVMEAFQVTIPEYNQQSNAPVW